MAICEVSRKLLTGPKNSEDPIVVKHFKRSTKYDSKRKILKDPKIISILLDFGIHIKYGYDIPSEYNLHSIEKGWKVVHLMGNNLIVKFKIVGNVVELARLGSHKEVYGSTRKFK